LFGPLDLIIGLVHGHYPTEATIISVVSFLVGLFLWRYNLRQGLGVKPEPTPAIEVGSSSSENEALYAATARLNLALGTGLLFFGLALNLLFIVNGLVGTQQISDSAEGNLVELGFVILFNLLVAGLEVFAARIYTTGRG
jgi:hypothetical protein